MKRIDARPLSSEKAFNSFVSGNFLLAYDEYRRAGRIMGQPMVAFNLELCLSRMFAPFNGGHTTDLRMACVMDKFSLLSFEPECDMHYLLPDTGIAQLEEIKPHILFVESTWHGKNDEWNDKVTHPDQYLKSIVAWCKGHKVPTVFWNKEDPVNFNIFIRAAALFDFVFTTDMASVGRYKRRLGHERIFLLPFAVQPRLYNPVEKYKRKKGACFAGSYYAKYLERVKDLENFTKAISGIMPMEIYDRYFAKNIKNFTFPREYSRFIKGCLPPEKVEVAYKGYEIGLNLNTIKNSPSMFARRVFELLASNTLVFSNYSPGIKKLFGDLVFCSDDARALAREYGARDEIELSKIKLAALRKILLEHCYADRLAYVLQKVFAWSPAASTPAIMVLSPINNRKEANKALLNFQRQSFEPKILFLLAQPRLVRELEKDFESLPNVKTINLARMSEMTLDALAPKANYAACFHPRDWYGGNYLLDLALATKYAPAQAIGKAEYWQAEKTGIQLACRGCAYQADQQFPLRRCLLDKNAMVNMTVASFLRAFKVNKIYAGQSVDCFNYCADAPDRELEKDVENTAGDKLDADLGESLRDMIFMAENLDEDEENFTQIGCISAQSLFQLCAKNMENIVFMPLKDNTFKIASSMRDDDTASFTAWNLSRYDLPNVNSFLTWLDADGSLDIGYSMTFRDENKDNISSVFEAGGGANLTELPEDARYFHFSLIIRGKGVAVIRGLRFGRIN